MLAGNKKADILKCFWKIMKKGKPKAAIPPKWDGKAAERIVDVLLRRGQGRLIGKRLQYRGKTIQ